MRRGPARERQAIGAAPAAPVGGTLRSFLRLAPAGTMRLLPAGEPPSLFVVSLPRSLSSLLYEASCRSLRVSAPAWTTAGEILNRERVPRRHERLAPEDERFTVEDVEPEVFARMTEYLERTARRRGFAYKDVVQPFVVAGWDGLSEFRVLRIKRDVAEIAYSMVRRQWEYPSRAASLHRDPPWSIVEGLLRAEAAIDALPGQTLAYEEAVLSHEPLEQALHALYPGLRLAPVRYIDRGFARTRRRLEGQRRGSELFRQIQRAVEIVRERLLLEEPPPERVAQALS